MTIPLSKIPEVVRFKILKILLHIRNTCTLLTLITIQASSLHAHAELLLIGEGKKQVLDSAQFNEESLKRYEIFKTKCTQCHTMQRPIEALTSGITPVSGSPFNASTIKQYVAKMMRKPKAKISREDGKEIVLFLYEALKLATPTDSPAPSDSQ